MTDLFAGEQRADHPDPLDQSAVARGLSGHRSPVMCSFDASPEPSATHSRPGNSSPSVAIAWAMIAG